MKRYGLRAMALTICVVALFSIVATSLTVSELETKALDLIPEVSNAAGLALVKSYATTKTIPELRTLAAEGRTSGVRLSGSATIRKINDPLQPLALLTTDELKVLALAGDADGAYMYYVVQLSTLKADDLLAAATTNENEVLELAAGTVLGGFWAPGSFNEKPEDELLDLVVNGESAGIRTAAAVALTAYFILNSELTAVEVEAAILNETLFHPELAAAYQGFLAYLYSL